MVGEHPKMKIPTVEVVHTVLHAGGKFGGGAIVFPVAYMELVLQLLMLSAWMEVTVKRDGKIYNISFERGNTVKPLVIIGDCPLNETGTTTRFYPDSEILKDINFGF